MTEHPLIAFLRARWDELAAANWHDADCQMFKPVPPGFPFETLTCNCGVSALVEADIATKRKLLEQFRLRGNSVRATVQPSTGGVWDDLLRILAEPHASHPGYPKDV